MLIRITIFLLLISATGLAQNTIPQATFKHALDEELTKRENGSWLYAHSPGYRNIVLRHISEKFHLGAANQPKSSQIIPQRIQNFFGDVSNDPFGQENPSAVISRNDPTRMVIGSSDAMENIRYMPVYLSTDAGMSWKTSHLHSPPNPYIANGNPALAADQFNGFYYAYSIYNDDASLSNIIVSHSADGITWTHGDLVMPEKLPGAIVEDQVSIAVDMGNFSATFGRVYVSWWHYENDASKVGLRLAWSDDFGTNWSQPVSVDSGFGTYSQIKVDKNGVIFYTFSRHNDNSSIGEHDLLVSYDNGVSFTRRKIADFHDYPFSTSQEYPTLKGNDGIRTFPNISIDYDKQSGTLHAVYGSYTKWNDSVSTAALYYTYSNDEGRTWADPYTIGFVDDSAALHTDRFMPSIAVDGTTEDIHILYYSSQNDPKNIKMEAFRVVFAKEFPITYTKLSDSLFDPLHVTDYTGVPFIGDYISCNLQGGSYLYAWTENRKGLPSEQYLDGEIFAFVNSVALGVPALHQVSANSLSIYSACPNPSANGRLTLGFAVPQGGVVSLSLSSIDGAYSRKLFSGDISSGTYEKEFDISTLASGDYLVTLESNNSSVEKKVIVIR